MAAEHVADGGVDALGGRHAAFGRVGVFHIPPLRGHVGTGVHQQGAAAQPCRERQRLQKGDVAVAELVVRPLRAQLAAVAGVGGRRQGHGVVIAQHTQGSLLGQVAHLLHHGHGLAAVAHQVAQQRKLFGAVGAGVLQAGVQGLAVGVDVGQQGDFHGVVSNPIIARMAECQLAGGSTCVASKQK